ncbi:hypothetical protein Metev_0628 [Methanohalobium evestigatum Z-7303]|uniref:Uncharacterized protein n=1 Tax=Methanohalobium evestigatum (strain ATCC BAA-1072 / DSM 3721 / NBRC 107634 / OCM 161 / Z-7303) TaxID=644295 RepID=D7E8J2_METEZ|nr:hypothetical protein [Methanohalobium evestigatum]ADI73534.1 hypothetical protein Metev_0628 [Methanohalobium evestigatum Z-7303]
MNKKTITIIIILLVLMGIGCTSSPDENDSDDTTNQTDDNQEQSDGIPKQAPQLSIVGGSESINGNKIIKLEHRGGDKVTFVKGETTVEVNDKEVVYNLNEDDKFREGDTYYIYYDSHSGDLVMINPNKKDVESISDELASIPGMVSVRIIDDASHQIIADMTIR